MALKAYSPLDRVISQRRILSPLNGRWWVDIYMPRENLRLIYFQIFGSCLLRDTRAHFLIRWRAIFIRDVLQKSAVLPSAIWEKMFLTKMTLKARRTERLRQREAIMHRRLQSMMNPFSNHLSWRFELEWPCQQYCYSFLVTLSHLKHCTLLNVIPSDTLRTTGPLVNKVFITWLTERYFWHFLSPDQQAAAPSLGLDKPKGVGYGIGVAFGIVVMQCTGSIILNHND